MKEPDILSPEDRAHLAVKGGLQSSEVPEYRGKIRRKCDDPPVREPLWLQYLKKYDDPIIKILIIAVVISLIVSIIQGISIYDTLGIIIAILLATGISFFNEYRSSKEFDVLNAHRDDVGVKVVRDGHPSMVPSRDIVVGDLIIIEAGDAVPADGWLIASDAFSSDESAFTGESEPVAKESGRSGPERLICYCRERTDDHRGSWGLGPDGCDCSIAWYRPCNRNPP